jgi:hypothetical protein
MRRSKHMVKNLKKIGKVKSKDRVVDGKTILKQILHLRCVRDEGGRGVN